MMQDQKYNQGLASRPPWTARLWRRWLQIRFLLFDHHRHDRLVLEWVAGRPLMVLPQVLNPQLFRSGAFFAQALGQELALPGATVLDMGTGSGVCAVAAGEWAGRVVAVDLNPEAVRCARINVLLNRGEGCIDVRQGDLFEPVAGERFDLVLFNPPYLRGTPRSMLDRALYATDVIERFAADLGEHLTAEGAALVLLSTIGDLTAQLELFRAQGWMIEAVAQHELVGEVMVIYRLRPRR